LLCSFFTSVYPVNVEQLFYFGGLRMVLELSQFENFLFHLLTKFDENLPIILNSFTKVSIFFPVFFFLDFLDRKLQHFTFGL